MTSTRIYGLIGYPVKHSLSALMHNAAFKALKINARYKLFETPPEKLGGFLSDLAKKNICGLNVTIPHKEKVIPYLKNRLSPEARAIGAVNTLVINKTGALKGYNTDCLGFSRHLSELKIKPRKVALIGAGGAAKAICFALGARHHAEEICIYDIDKFKSLALFKKFHTFFPKTKFMAVSNIEELGLADKDLLINASPVGMEQNDPCLLEASLLYPGLFVYDVIYNPAQTKLLKLAEEEGCRFANGLGMLLYQGAAGFELWTKKKAPVEIMRAELKKGVNKL